MKEVTLTCPLTGANFQALECADGALIVKNAITGEDIRIGYNPQSNFYIMKRKWFDSVEYVDMAQAMELLGVTRQRIYQIYERQTVKSFKINGKVHFMKQDILEYAESRKVGAPKRKKVG